MIVGEIIGHAFVAGEINDELIRLLGKERSQSVQNIIENTSSFNPNPVIKTISVLSLIFTSTGVFIAIQDGLNVVWKVRASGEGAFLIIMKDRALSFFMTLLVGVMFILLMIVQGLIEVFSDYIKEAGILFIFILNNAVSFIICTFLFALIYKVMPRINFAWKSLWLSSITVALLFILGKFLLIKYLASIQYNSTYAAGAVIMILLWIFYSSYILFAIAELTQVYYRKAGRKIRLKPYTLNMRNN
jgi:membrane protein